MLHRGVPTRTATYLTLSDMLGAQILTNKAGSFTYDKDILGYQRHCRTYTARDDRKHN